MREEEFPEEEPVSPQLRHAFGVFGTVWFSVCFWLCVVYVAFFFVVFVFWLFRWCVCVCLCVFLCGLCVLFDCFLKQKMSRCFFFCWGTMF